MSDEPKTKREVLIARGAAAKMRCAVHHEADESDTGRGGDWQRHTNPCFACQQRAAECYPLPKVTRPRVARFKNYGDADVAFRCVNGVFQSQDVRAGVRPDPDGWVIRHQIPAEWVERLADLKANPTEEVEE